MFKNGNITIDNINTSKGDVIAIKEESKISLKCQPDTEIIFIEVPGLTEAR